MKDDLIFTDRTKMMFLAFFDQSLDLAIAGDVFALGYFNDLNLASVYYAEYELDETLCGLDGMAALLKLKEVVTDSFIYNLNKMFINVRRPVYKTKTIKMVDVEMIGSSADLIYAYCKENDCDPSYAVTVAFGIVKPLPSECVKVYAQDQVIAGAVADMIDKKFGKRMAEIEMTMGLISEPAATESIF